METHGYRSIHLREGGVWVPLEGSILRVAVRELPLMVGPHSLQMLKWLAVLDCVGPTSIYNKGCSRRTPLSGWAPLPKIIMRVAVR